VGKPNIWPNFVKLAKSGAAGKTASRRPQNIEIGPSSGF